MGVLNEKRCKNEDICVNKTYFVEKDYYDEQIFPNIIENGYEYFN